jgi:hypothetical protein
LPTSLLECLGIKPERIVSRKMYWTNRLPFCGNITNQRDKCTSSRFDVTWAEIKIFPMVIVLKLKENAWLQHTKWNNTKQAAFAHGKSMQSSRSVTLLGTNFLLISIKRRSCFFLKRNKCLLFTTFTTMTFNEYSHSTTMTWQDNFPASHYWLQFQQNCTKNCYWFLDNNQCFRRNKNGDIRTAVSYLFVEWC